jgi:hypothetical protein
MLEFHHPAEGAAVSLKRGGLEMKVATRLLTLVALAGVAFGMAPDASAAALGSIRGLVRDARGAPLAGAAIQVVTDAPVGRLKTDKIIKRAETNADGQFLAADIAPGKYRVKAEANGFAPVELAAFVKPNKVTVFDSILLRRSGTLSEETDLNLDPKYASRGSRGTIFHLDSDGDDPISGQRQTLANPVSDTHGFVQAFSQTSSGGAVDRGSFTGTNFAVSQLLGGDSTLVISGQAGFGAYSPQRLQALTTLGGIDRHRIALGLGYGRFTLSRGADVSRLGQISMSATDTWQIAGPVLVIYGLQFDRFSEGAAGTSVLPRVGIEVNATARTQLYAAMLPGSSVDAQSKVNLESAEIVFPEQTTTAIAPHSGMAADRSYRLQFGGQHTISEDSSIEVMAFLDTISGHPVGLMAAPMEGADAQQSEFRAQDQGGHCRGIRAVYHHRLGRTFDASVGYAFGQGQFLDPRGITSPANLFRDGFFQVVTAKLDANFMTTGTKISTIMRVAPSRAIFAIDPFQGQLTNYDPNLNVVITQELPMLGFLPGQWAAIVDLRNLLDQQASVTDDRQELIASRFHRLLRIGISLRF